VGGNQISADNNENQNGSFSKKTLKIELPYEIPILVLSIYPKESKSAHKRYYILMFIAALFTVAKV
jgi:hypothetical protein